MGQPRRWVEVCALDIDQKSRLVRSADIPRVVVFGVIGGKRLWRLRCSERRGM